MTRKRLLVAAAFLLVAGLGHLEFWYSPRLRPATPANDLPGRLFHDAHYERALWLPYPHQNLPALAERTGLDGPALTAGLRLAGVLDAAAGPEDLADLVPFLPTASSMAIAVAERESGDEAPVGVAAVRLYPLAAGFVRLAGVLAGNPWMSGGTVDLGSAGSGQVAWNGTTWLLGVPDLSGLDTPRDAVAHDDEPKPSPALAFLRRDDHHQALRADRQGLRLGAAGESDGADLDVGRPVLQATEAALVVLERDPVALVAQVLVLFPAPRGTPASDLPRSAVLVRAPDGSAANRWDLPGEALLRLADHEVPETSTDDWHAVAVDRRALDTAVGIKNSLPTEPWPRLGLWLDVDRAAPEFERLLAGVEGSPLVDLDTERRWRDGAHVLSALRGHATSLATVSDERGSLLGARLVLVEDPTSWK